MQCYHSNIINDNNHSKHKLRRTSRGADPRVGQKKFRQSLSKDLIRMEITWEEAEVAAHQNSVGVWPNASTWMVGWIKVKEGQVSSQKLKKNIFSVSIIRKNSILSVHQYEVPKSVFKTIIGWVTFWRRLQRPESGNTIFPANRYYFRAAAKN